MSPVEIRQLKRKLLCRYILDDGFWKGWRIIISQKKLSDPRALSEFYDKEKIIILNPRQGFVEIISSFLHETAHEYYGGSPENRICATERNIWYDLANDEKLAVLQRLSTIVEWADE